MTKPYTDEELSRQLAADRTWRVREISDLKSAIIRGDAPLKQVLMRALVTLCYAHWEGSVRFAARKYLEHVSLRKFRYDQLTQQFLTNHFLPRLAAFATSKGSIADRCRLVEDIISAERFHFRKFNDDLINTKANLNSEVLADICRICGLAPDAFEEYATHIDVVLLKRRNSIAHGENAFVDVGDLDDIAETTIELMRSFGDALDNLATMQGYRAA